MYRIENPISLLSLFPCSVLSQNIVLLRNRGGLNIKTSLYYACFLMFNSQYKETKRIKGLNKENY